MQIMGPEVFKLMNLSCCLKCCLVVSGKAANEYGVWHIAPPPEVPGLFGYGGAPPLPKPRHVGFGGAPGPHELHCLGLRVHGGPMSHATPSLAVPLMGLPWALPLFGQFVMNLLFGRGGG